jgi:hypothetical protein
VDTCFTPMVGSEFDVLDAGITSWNGIVGMLDMFSLATGDSNCTTSVSDNAWETALVPSNNAVLDGNNGITVQFVRPCNLLYNGHLYKADLLVSQSLDQAPLDELSSALGARETAIHEYGHVLGAEHEDGDMAVMCTFDACGKVGRSGVVGYRTLGTAPKRYYRMTSISGFPFCLRRVRATMILPLLHGSSPLPAVRSSSTGSTALRFRNALGTFSFSAMVS